MGNPSIKDVGSFWAVWKIASRLVVCCLVPLSTISSLPLTPYPPCSPSRFFHISPLPPVVCHDVWQERGPTTNQPARQFASGPFPHPLCCALPAVLARMGGAPAKLSPGCNVGLVSYTITVCRARVLWRAGGLTSVLVLFGRCCTGPTSFGYDLVTHDQR